MLVDTHCHLNLKHYDNDRREVLRRAFDREIKMIQVGISIRTSIEVIELAKEYENGIWASVGIHPTEILSVHNQMTELSELAKESKVIAIGECGLDYYHLPPKNKEIHMHQQEMAFKRHIELAKSLSLPLIIHCRDAYDEMLQILSSESGVKGVIHCFTGSLSQALRFIDLGMYISFTGIITFPSAGDLRDTLKGIPLERIMVETDAPYLAPESHRGSRNEPIYVEEIARKIGEIHGSEFDEVARITTHNAHTLFGI